MVLHWFTWTWKRFKLCFTMWSHSRWFTASILGLFVPSWIFFGHSCFRTSVQNSTEGGDRTWVFWIVTFLDYQMDVNLIHNFEFCFLYYCCIAEGSCSGFPAVSLLCWLVKRLGYLLFVFWVIFEDLVFSVVVLMSYIKNTGLLVGGG